MPPRQGNQRLAMIGQHGKQFEPVGKHQKGLVLSDAVQRHQARNLPEADGAHVTGSRVIIDGQMGRNIGLSNTAISSQLIEQRLCLLQIGGVETLGEPVVDGRYEVRRLPALVFPDQDPCQVRGGSEFEKARFLSAGYAQGIAQIFLDNSGWGTLGVQQ